MSTLEQKILSRLQTENQLLNKKIGFSQAYVCLKYLVSVIEKHPYSVTRKTVAVIVGLLRSLRYNNKKQSYFLYKEAADALIIISKDKNHPFSSFLILKLQKLVLISDGKKQRAISEALGSLPLDIQGPDLSPPLSEKVYSISFEMLLENCNIADIHSMKWKGRTLIFPVEHDCDNSDRQNDCQIMCIKFTTETQSSSQLLTEISWLRYLNKNSLCSDNKLHVPLPLSIDGSYLFKINNLSDSIIVNQNISENHTAMIYFTRENYFYYPNEPELYNASPEDVLEVFKKNAFLLGKLTSKGIIHTALIPLFHNRTQQHRREDQGRYNWEQGGRLDQWLESSRYPNFAESGLRDFEHLISISSTNRLHHYIGEHLLSFILVVGSYFRNLESKKSGWDTLGKPLDMRYLFDKHLFSKIIHQVIQSYYNGLTGSRFDNIDLAVDANLIDRLIDAMGIDNHMEEILHIHDQDHMSDNDFINFLVSRGVEDTEAEAMKRGKEEIVLHTGPHLGGFNQQISVPELISCLFILASLCISDRYLMENRLKAYLN